MGATPLEKGTQEQVYDGTKDFCFNNSTAVTSDEVYFRESLINKGGQLEITLKFKEFDSTTYPCFFEREDKGA
ncbi:MAG: hypothetical protein MJ200_03460 [Mycoplasmoidaceae bacterium]|nr:hypothetical protein [Mycoplasmoidaceae bacterium]